MTDAAKRKKTGLNKAEITQEEKPKTLRDLTETELKALGFDEKMKIEQAQMFLNAVIAELNRRQEAKNE